MSNTNTPKRLPIIGDIVRRTKDHASYRFREGGHVAGRLYRVVGVNMDGTPTAELLREESSPVPRTTMFNADKWEHATVYRRKAMPYPSCPEGTTAVVNNEAEPRWVTILCGPLRGKTATWTPEYCEVVEQGRLDPEAAKEADDEQTLQMVETVRAAGRAEAEAKAAHEAAQKAAEEAQEAYTKAIQECRDAREALNKHIYGGL